MKTVLSVVLFIVALIVFVCTVISNYVYNYNFNKECCDYLKLAAYSPSIEKSTQFLEKALVYLEKEEKTTGNSAFIFKTPSSDIGIWFSQLKEAQKTLVKCLPDSISGLEKTNALMKIRETIENGTILTLPPYLDTFPKHIFFLWTYILSLMIMFIALILIMVFYYYN